MAKKPPHRATPDYYPLASQALQEMLIEKKVLTGQDVLQELKNAQSRTPQVGARIVARAWSDTSFKERLLADGKAALAELGVRFTESKLVVVGVIVHDSNAEIRYLVIPLRPAKTEGFDEAALAALVTRDSLVGAGLALAPARPRRGRGSSAREGL